MSSSLPDTLVFRRPGPDDLEVAARILAAEERRVRGESAWGVEETRDWWTWSNLDESWFVDADGESIAFRRVDGAGQDRCLLGICRSEV